MAFSRSLAAAFFGLLALATSAIADGTGDGTAYSGSGEKDKTGFNSCQFGELDSHWESYYAALPSGSFNKATDCGRCIAVKGLDAGASGEWVIVMVVDECASCSGGDVDFSTNAFKDITGFAWDRKQITWKWAECDGSSSSSSSDGEASADAEAASTSSDEPSADDEAKESAADDESAEDADTSADDTSKDAEGELEGDLNGNGKLSRYEKRELKKKQKKAAEEEANNDSGNRKMLRMRA